MTDELALPTLICLRCEHTWYPRTPRHPKVCPKCKSPYWNKEREKRWAIEKARGKEGKVMTWEGNSTALHEAGHAVYAYASGFLRPSHIEITPDGTGFVDCHDPPDEESPSTGPVAMHRKELHYALKLAGEVAQEIAGVSEADRGNLILDSLAAGELLDSLADQLDDSPEEIHERAWTSAREVLTRHWDVIVDLAKGVEIRWSLSGDELEGFLESRLGPFALS